MFGSEIAGKFKDDKIDVVISPAVGGIVIGTEAGRQLNVKTIFAERENGKMILRRGFSINSGERVLVVEDVVTTGGSIFEVMEAVKTFGGITAGVAFIVDRSNGKVKFGVKQFSLTKLEAVQYKAEEIPDWMSNIPVTKPGSRNLK